MRSALGANLGVFRAEIQKNSDKGIVDSRAAKKVKITVVFEILSGVIDQVKVLWAFVYLRSSAIWWDVLHRLPNQSIEIITHVSSSSGHSRNLPSNPELSCQHFLRWPQARKSAIMANDEILTDDYVAELLAKDAKDSAIKYSSMGLDAFKQSKYVLPT